MKSKRQKQLCAKHRDNEILVVCLERDCTDQRLCCISCIDEDHSKHDFISFRKLEELMSEELQDLNQNSEKQLILHHLESAQNQLIKKLKFLENKVLQQIAQIQTKILLIFNQIYKLFRIPTHEDFIQQLSMKFTESTISKIIEGFDVCEKFKFGSADATEFILDLEVNRFEGKVNEIAENVKESIGKLGEIVEKIDFSSKSQVEDNKFDVLSKSGDINVCDTLDMVYKTYNSGNRTLVLANRPFTPINNRCSFKILKNGDGFPSICLGVAVKNVVKKFNYSVNVGYQKGIYGIDQASNTSWGSIQESSVATAWNHKNQGFCNVPLDFQIGEEQVVNVEIDYSSQTILFETDSDIYQMPIDLSVKDLYPFAGMVYQNACVQILNTQEQLINDSNLFEDFE